MTTGEPTGDEYFIIIKKQFIAVMKIFSTLSHCPGALWRGHFWCCPLVVLFTQVNKKRSWNTKDYYNHSYSSPAPDVLNSNRHIPARDALAFKISSRMHLQIISLPGLLGQWNFQMLHSIKIQLNTQYWRALKSVIIRNKKKKPFIWR